MTREELIQFQRRELEKIVEISQRKNRDYCGVDATDPFRNFKMTEQMGIASTEMGILTRMGDKMIRITNLLRTGEAAVLDEKIEDTLRDLAAYSLLLSAYIKSKELEGKHPAVTYNPETKDFTVLRGDGHVNS